MAANPPFAVLQEYITVEVFNIQPRNTVYVKTFEGENFRGSSTMCIM